MDPKHQDTKINQNDLYLITTKRKKKRSTKKYRDAKHKVKDLD